MKVILSTEVGYPIAGVEYSTSKVGLIIESEMDSLDIDSLKGDLVETGKLLQEQLSSLGEDVLRNILTDKRFKGLASSVPQESVEDLQVEIKKKYEGVMSKYKAEVLRLQGLCEKNNINFKDS